MFSEPLTLGKDGRVGEADEGDYWELFNDRTIRIVCRIHGNTQRVLTAKLLPAWDWERNRPTHVFTGLDDTSAAPPVTGAMGLGAWATQAKFDGFRSRAAAGRERGKPQAGERIG